MANEVSSNGIRKDDVSFPFLTIRSDNSVKAILGDNAGANTFQVDNTTPASVFSVDSDGDCTILGSLSINGLGIYQLYDAVVDINGNGDFTSVASAYSSGAKSVFVRKGVYPESSNIVIPDGGLLVGEAAGLTFITLSGTAQVVIDGSAGVQETAGTISISTGGTIVTGSGTTFTNLAADDYILLGTGNSTIDGCSVIGNGSDGIDFDGDGHVVSSNIIKNNGGVGVQCGINGSVVSNVIIGNSGHGVAINNDTDLIVNSNNIRNNGGDGVNVSGSGNEDCIINNNRITGNSGNGIEIALGSLRIMARGNNVTGNSGTNLIDNGTSSSVGNNIT